MAHSTLTGEIEPCQSFLLGAKYDFMAQNIRNGKSFVYVTASSLGFTKKDNFKSKVRSTSHHAYNTHKDTCFTSYKHYQCDKCYKSFSREYNLSQHRIIHTGVKAHECRTYHTTITKLLHLKSHADGIDTGDKPYKCGTCHKRFSQTGNLHQHEMIHTAVKPLKCGTCDKRFRRAHDLKRPERIHAGVKPYKCGSCEKTFTATSSLKRHCKESH